MYFIYIDFLNSYVCFFYVVVILLLVVVIIVIMLLLSFCWLCEQIVGQEKFEWWVKWILNGECEYVINSDGYEWLFCVSCVIDYLLVELIEVREECNCVDILICIFVVQDVKIGFSNCQFFDNQLMI